MNYLTKNRVYLLTRRWPHHSAHSGYDLFARYVGLPLATNAVPSFLVPGQLYYRITQNMRGYDLMGLGLEMRAARHMARHKNCLYHLLYGDNCYFFLGRLNGWRGHRVIASFHHPPRKFAQVVRDTENLRRLAAVIVVGTNQFASFTGIMPPERVFLVPHPVDTSYFAPPSDFSMRDNNVCLFVGAHLRDLDTLCSVIENAWVRAPQLKFVVVVHPDHLSQFTSIVGNLVLLSNISELALRQLYQTSTVLIQPLLDSTTNNAVLEGIACGLPLIVTDVGGIRDYVDDDTAEFVPAFDADAMLQAILRVVSDHERRRLMASKARQKALSLDWSVVSQQMGAVYEQILSWN